MNESQIASIVKRNKVCLSPEEIARLRREAAGYEKVERNPDGSFKEVDPKVAARSKVIAPWIIPGVTMNWLDAIRRLSDHYGGQEPVAYLFGAGASTLKQDLGALEGQFVYGINWTRKWFEPTMLQIMDDVPLRSQVLENRRAMPGVLVTSKTLYGRHRRKSKMPESHVLFDCRDKATDHRSFVFPDKPWEPLEHYSNSLGVALQIVYGMGFRKVVLLGFDFGGEHFFGDGKQEGCANHYGLAGEVKQDLHVKLLALAHVLRQHGCRVVQVGPTKLDWAFDQVATLKEAQERHVRA